MTQKDKTKAAALLKDLLAGLTGDEVRQMVAAEEERRAADEAQREAARAALLVDQEAEQRRLRAERERERQLAERDRDAARKRAIEARQAVEAARAAYLAAAAHCNRMTEAHRRAHEKWSGFVDRAPGEMLPWDRPVGRFNDRDAVTLRELERAS